MHTCWIYVPWKDRFLAAVDDIIPTKRVKGRCPVPWFSSANLDLIKKKESVRRKLKQHPSVKLREKFRSLRAQIRSDQALSL